MAPTGMLKDVEDELQRKVKVHAYYCLHHPLTLTTGAYTANQTLAK